MLASEAHAGLTVSTATSQPPAPVRSTIHQGIDWLLEQSIELLRVWVRGADLLATPPWPTQAVAIRGPAGVNQHEWRLNTSEVNAGPLVAAMEVRVTLIPDPSDEQRITWQIEVTQPDRWPDFAGIGVTLYPAHGEPQRRVTGRDGVIEFTALTRQEVATMQVAIELSVK